MTLPDDVDILYNGLHRDDLRRILQGDDPSFDEYREKSLPRLHRIVANLILMKDQLTGPTLDVASGNGSLYRAVKSYFPEMLPYSIAELKASTLEIDGDNIPVHEFHCDRDRLPVSDNSLGVILFCDVIEHLIVDPMWTLLEFNRVLKPGGHLIITTPNAAGAVRALYILNAINPGREIEYKPTSPYQRHNREWTVNELQGVLLCAGFDHFNFTTNPHLLEPVELFLLEVRGELEKFGMKVKGEDSVFGPEIFFSARKAIHRTLDDDLPPEERWPKQIYSSYEGYRKRPKVFPIIIGDDYC